MSLSIPAALRGDSGFKAAPLPAPRYRWSKVAENCIYRVYLPRIHESQTHTAAGPVATMYLYPIEGPEDATLLVEKRGWGADGMWVATALRGVHNRPVTAATKQAAARFLKLAQSTTGNKTQAQLAGRITP